MKIFLLSDSENRLLIFILLLICLFTSSCSLGNSGGNTDSSVNDQDQIEERHELTDEEVMHLAVKKWCEAINERDYDLLERMYAPTVFLYTMEMTAKDAAREHRKATDNTPDFKQYIKGDIEIEDLADGDKKINYIKYTMHDGQGKDYPCYLVMTKIDGKWRISKESDLITDENVRRRKSER